MSEFESWLSYYNFSHTVRQKSRYGFEEAVRKFIESVIATSEKRLFDLRKGGGPWRAQLGHDLITEEQDGEKFEIPFPYNPGRMKPLPYSAREGRVNPKGIPCLYLASDKETAMAEVRPWIGSFVSVGQFETLKDLRLVDCAMRTDQVSKIYFNEPDSAEREDAVWKDINRAFSEPTTSDDITADYAPTQVLAEAFRSVGFDGIIYKSAYGKGYNFAFFSLEVARLVSCSVFEVKKLDFEFSEFSNPYYVKYDSENSPNSTTANRIESQDNSTSRT